MSAFFTSDDDSQTLVEPVSESKIFYIGELNRAIQNHELCLQYQPRYSNGGGLVSLEALVRWNHPEQGLFYPHSFIPLADEVGLIP